MTTIDVERRRAVALVTINNPTRKNAAALEMRKAPRRGRKSGLIVKPLRMD